MRNPWPIGIIVFFVVFVSSMVGFVLWSTHQREDLVSPTYYADEIRYQQRIDAMKRTQAEGIVPAIAFDTAARKIELRFPQPAALNAATGTVTLYRPSEAGLDERRELRPDAAGLQQITAANLKAGLWRVKAEWTTAGKAYYAEDSIMVQ
jgi:nitrogen fixation protein FixH